MEERFTGSINRPFVIIGAGNVGNALGRALHACELNVAVVISRSHPDATVLASATGAGVAATHVASIPSQPCNIVCAVPDNEILPLAESMASVRRDWLHSIVFHTSGAHSSKLLDPVRELGALTASFHPLLSIPDGTAPDMFKGCSIGIEGDKRAVAMAEKLAIAIGATPITISPESKAAYHLGASIVSNFTVALFGMAHDVLSTAGLSDVDVNKLYGHLARNTIENISEMGHGAALTGPIARGDTDTVEIHLQFMRENAPQLMPVYSSLATETVRLAVKAGKIDSERARQVLDLVHKALLPSLDQDH